MSKKSRFVLESPGVLHVKMIARAGTCDMVLNCYLMAT